MCRRSAKRNGMGWGGAGGREGGGSPSALLHGDRLSTTPKKSAVAIRGFNENVNPRAYIRSSGFCNLVVRRGPSRMYSASDNIFLPETIACLAPGSGGRRAIKPLPSRKISRREEEEEEGGEKKETKRNEIARVRNCRTPTRGGGFMRVIKFCRAFFRARARARVRAGIPEKFLRRRLKSERTNERTLLVRSTRDIAKHHVEPTEERVSYDTVDRCIEI